MRPIGRSSSFILALVFTAGTFVACSSSKNNNDGGNGGAGGGGAGGKGGTGGGGAGGGTGGGGAGGKGGTGGGAGGTTDAGHDATTSTDGQMFDVSTTDSLASMTLTSTALTEGAAFPSANTCAGVNTSPPLTWTAGPAGTMSYAITLTDLSINAVHWVVWDLPTGTTSLPANLPGDTTLTTPVTGKQLHRVAFFGAGGAYRGPCPSGNTHTYQFEVNAVNTATLGGITATTTTDQIRALIQAASVGHGDLSGTSNATAPPADASGN